jgi:hypothetical protein
MFSPSSGVKRPRSDILLEEKWAIVAYSAMYRQNGDGRLVDNSRIFLAKRFGCSENSIKNVLTEYDKQIANGVIFPDLKPKGRELNHVPSGLTDEVRINIYDIHEMSKGKYTIRQMAVAYENEFSVQMHWTTMQKYWSLMEGNIRSSYIKPKLQTQQQINRLNFTLGKIVHAGHGVYEFDKMLNTVHVDEKWFYVSKLKQRQRMLPGTDRQNCTTTRHKSHIEKIMFLCAIGVPQWYQDSHGMEQYWDGKIGIYPFIKWTVAKRKSKHRNAGAPVMESVNVTAETYRDVITRSSRDDPGVLQSIRAKVPWGSTKITVIQHDGAPGHEGKGNDVLLTEAGAAMAGQPIIFDTQPAQSPDFNKCDLSLFASLQAATDQLKMASQSKEVLMDSVTQAYNDYPTETLVRIHALQFEIYRSVMMNQGGNQFYTPHSGIRARQNRGAEVADYSVPAGLVEQARATVLALQQQIDEE